VVRKVRRLAIIILVIASLILMAVPLVKADCQTECLGCAHTIKVIPVGSTETGEPLVTTTPANLMIFHTGKGPIENVWLLIVLNETTYNALNQITIDGKQFMTKEDFQLVTTKKIPPLLPNSTTGYPGSLCQYNVAAIKDKMNEKGNPVYYGVKSFLAQITKTPTNFTLAVELNSPANLKALILALGRYEYHSKCCNEINCAYKPFNRCSSFSNSTFVVPDIAPLAVTASSFGALGIFAIKRRKK
jgi:hypothetical protein